MAWPKWKKRLAWCLAIPTGLAVIGWVSMNVAEARLDSAIRQEEARLEALGIRVKPLTSQDDAGPLYRRIAKEGSQKKPEELLAMYEEAASRMANFGTDDGGLVSATRAFDVPILEVAQLSNAFARKKRWDLAIRSERALSRIEQQSLVDEQPRSGFGFSVSGVGFASRVPIEPAVRSKLRKYLESIDPLDSIKANLSRLVLGARKGLVAGLKPTSFSGLSVSKGQSVMYYSTTASPPSARLAFWENWASNHVLFQKLADLAILKAAYAKAEATLRHPFASGTLSLGANLDQIGGWPSKWAKSRLVNQWTIAEPPSAQEIRRRSMLIAIDLADQMEAGGNPRPTWSKELCRDPRTDAPVRPTLAKGKVSFDRPDWRPISLQQPLSQALTNELRSVGIRSREDTSHHGPRASVTH